MNLDYGLISADSHVTEPPDCYARFIDPAYADRVPHIVTDARGGERYLIPGLDEMAVPMGLIGSAGRESSAIRYHARRPDEWQRSGWDPTCRIADQDRDGVIAEILYPSVGVPLGVHPDLDYREACMVAYNRWLEEYCAVAPDRLYGVGQASMRDGRSGAAEMRTIKAQGFRGVMMPGLPGFADYDDPSYDHVWAAAVELDLPLCFHIVTVKSQTGLRGPGINAMLNVVRTCQDIIGMLIFSGVFDRYPDLRIVGVESDAGWAPHYAWRMDHVYERHRHWNKTIELDRLPSEYFFGNVWLTFQNDWSAIRVIGELNVERLMWANDFPHSDSTWPDSRQLLSDHLADLDPADTRRIVRDNCAELFSLEVPERRDLAPSAR
ncbi:MAG: amidohydrolase family protein [Acidimicrobiales bacterium]